jgi:hypothetical protein
MNWSGTMKRALMHLPLTVVGLAVVLAILALGATSAHADAPLGEAKMARANKAASVVVRGRMATERPADFKLLESVQSAEIIVVQGSYDRVQDVLGAVGVPHLIVSPAELDQIELNAKQLLMINCPGTISQKAILKIQKFVRAGGFLYTTDWALTNVVQKAFPGYIKYNSRPTGNDVVGVQVAAKDNVFLQHLQLSKTEPKWWLESSSYPVKVLRPREVEVLITSTEMGKKYGAAPVAVTFPYGDGRVLHIVSHFYLQQNETRTVAENKDGDSWIEGETVLDPTLAGSLADNPDVAAAKGGDINSAYAAQQFTTNLIVTRKRDQKRIDGLYNRKMKRKKAGAFKSGAKVKVVGKKKGKTKVRAMNGDEMWFDDAEIE